MSSDTVNNISNKIYDQPIQRLYELEGCDQGQSTNELFHLIDSGTSSQTTDDTPSQIVETSAEQTKLLVDPIQLNSEEPNDGMGEEAARTRVRYPAYRTRRRSGVK